MGVVNYLTIEGEIVSETRGGVERDYVPDALGSTIALLDNGQTKTDTWTYWPNGEVRTRTGTSTTPFTYGGTTGCYGDSTNALIYMRARDFRPSLTRWQTVDPLWPTAFAYVYCRGNPIRDIDPTGATPCPNGCNAPAKYCISNYCQDCRRNVNPDPHCARTCQVMIRIYEVSCGSQPVPKIRGSAACWLMLTGWDQRMQGGAGGQANSAWAGNCAQCCEDILGGPTNVCLINNTELMGDCVGDCLKGEWASGGLGFGGSLSIRDWNEEFTG